MTFEDYMIAVRKRLDGGGERIGQAYYNVLSQNRPDISHIVNGSHLDPFYDDRRLGDFLTFVMARW